MEAKDGDVAIDFIDKHKIDLTIIDLMLPEMNGYQLCRTIKTHYETPVLILTATHSLTSRE